MNYPMYGNNQFYMQDLQAMRDKIDRQMQQLQQPVQQPITQNFQLAPTPNNELESKYAANVEDVKNTLVMKTGVFATKDFSTIWVKDVTGKIRTFNTIEIVEMDDKDREIYALKKQIEEMKGMIKNESSSTELNEPVEGKKSTRVSVSKQSDAK